MFLSDYLSTTGKVIGKHYITMTRPSIPQNLNIVNYAIADKSLTTHTWQNPKLQSG